MTLRRNVMHRTPPMLYLTWYFVLQERTIAAWYTFHEEHGVNAR